MDQTHIEIYIILEKYLMMSANLQINNITVINPVPRFEIDELIGPKQSMLSTSIMRNRLKSLKYNPNFNLSCDHYKFKMGACNTKQNPQFNEWNPIQQFQKQLTLDDLTRQWDHTEAQVLYEKLNRSHGRFFELQMIDKIFPRLHKYSNATKQRVYKLMNYQNQKNKNRLYSKDVIISISLIFEADSPELTSQIAYYIYSDTLAPQDAKTGKKFVRMNRDGLQRFIKQNYQKLIDDDGIRFQATETKQSLQEIEQKQNITLNEFQNFFAKYRYDKFLELFLTRSRQQYEQIFVQKLKDSIKFQFEKNDPICVVENLWFQNWKHYIQKQYDVQINYEKMTTEENSVSASRISCISKANYQHSLSQVQKTVKRPGRINNYLLLSDSGIQLKPNLKQLIHYVIVPLQVWENFVKIYGGSPKIQRKYPQIKALYIVEVQIDENAYFRENTELKNYMIERSKQIIPYFNISNKNPKRCFYKYPGLMDWKPVESQATKFGDLVTSTLIYFCIVPNKLVNNFLDHYNLKEKKESQFIKQRIKNYCSFIDIEMEGAVIKAIVIDILPNNIILIRYKNSLGQFVQSKVKYAKLKALNPSDINLLHKRNYLTGMNNLQNNCYMNSTLQCLLKTPYFISIIEGVASKAKLDSNRWISSEFMNIYKDSKNSEIIDVLRFKRKFEKQYQNFEGNSHQDAQEFLLTLMQTLEKQSNEAQHRSNEILLKSQKSKLEPDKQTPKIVNYFSGLAYEIYRCSKCQNQKKRNSSFFSYSLNLPEHTDFQIEYTVVPCDKNNSWCFSKCMMTLHENSTVSEFINRIEQQQKISRENLRVYSIMEGQLYQRMGEFSEEPMKKYENFGFYFMVYEVQNEQSSHYIELRSRSENIKKKNYKFYDTPLLLPITLQKSWKEIQNQILKMFKGKFVEKFQEKEQSKSNFSVRTANLNLANKESFLEQKKRLNKNPYPFKLRLMSKDSNRCFICKKQLTKKKNSLYQKFNNCQGCQFEDQFKILKHKKLAYSLQDAYILIEWDHPERFLGIEINVHPSVQECKLNQKNRISRIQSIFNQNFKNEQLVEVTCQNPVCNNEFANRIQGIRQYPRILVIHLNRFRYNENGMVKIMNPIEYQEKMVINGYKYDLYASVIHEGTCNKGHYYSYVLFQNYWFKCNDERVIRVEKKEHLDPKAYILFYKKSGLTGQKSIMKI